MNCFYLKENYKCNKVAYTLYFYFTLFVLFLDGRDFTFLTNVSERSVNSMSKEKGEKIKSNLSKVIEEILQWGLILSLYQKVGGKLKHKKICSFYVKGFYSRHKGKKSVLIPCFLCRGEKI